MAQKRSGKCNRLLNKETHIQHSVKIKLLRYGCGYMDLEAISISLSWKILSLRLFVNPEYLGSINILINLCENMEIIPCSCVKSPTPEKPAVLLL